MRMPATHPFNPLPLLRLALACGDQGLANRYVCETIFRHVWRGGADAGDAQRLEALRQSLAPARDPAADDVKAELKANTEDAIAHGVFGVPTYARGRQAVLGLRRAAHAARLSRGRCLVRRRGLGEGRPGGRRHRARTAAKPAA